MKRRTGIKRTVAAMLSAGLIGSGMLITGLYGEQACQAGQADLKGAFVWEVTGGENQVSGGGTKEAVLPFITEDEEAMAAFSLAAAIDHYPKLTGEFLSALSGCAPGQALTDAGRNIVFYTQTDDRFADELFGEDPIGIYGCGPSAMAIVVSTLTDLTVDPVKMAEWAYDNGYWAPKSGSYHTLIAGAADAFSLHCESCPREDTARMRSALEEGSLIVVLMGKGQFTDSGHFIVLYGLTEDGKVKLADPNSEERTGREWDLETITKEAKSYAADGGPFWIIGQKEK